MLRSLFPKHHRRYEESCCVRELNDFGAWLTASGYSRENVCGHLRRLRNVLERAGEAVAGTCYSDRRLGELFWLQDAPPGSAVNYLATRRAYRRFLVSRGRWDAEPVDGPHERSVEEYTEFLREARGFAPSTTASHRSTVNPPIRAAPVSASCTSSACIVAGPTRAASCPTRCTSPDRSPIGRRSSSNPSRSPGCWRAPPHSLPRRTRRCSRRSYAWLSCSSTQRGCAAAKCCV